MLLPDHACGDPGREKAQGYAGTRMNASSAEVQVFDPAGKVGMAHEGGELVVGTIAVDGPKCA